ncbi:GyrI-like domain-containing protein [Mangrovimonas xylaniphaga]|uniref:GyrI-like domain-containing protein n=1 Tax=Mangrovimonas xylaniphaga TaxID=1645915 RepID=UPI0006B47158|nr:GyrI-like domain-containing protein [Mangrovimonas xylaniphaga]
MVFRIVQQPDLKLVGMRSKVSFETMGLETARLGRELMPRLAEISSRIGEYTWSVQVYESFNFETLSPQTQFDKWIGVEVENFDNMPEGLESLVIKGGKYFVFDYKGSIANYPPVWTSVFEKWLPQLGYAVDDRPHFEKLPASYNPRQEVNEEEIWIPIG